MDSLGGDADADVKISVVIPTYNSARFLKESLDSVVTQEYPAYEVIVADGASTDGTRELCEKYEGKIRFFQQDKNEGVGSAMNLGIREMKGEWFKVHDSDDILEPNALKVLAAAAKLTSAQVVYGDFSYVDSRGKNPRVRKFVPPEKREDFIVASWRNLVVSHVSAMVRGSCFGEVGLFDDTLESAEDYDWYLRAVMVHKVRFHHVPVVIARYRRHKGQTTHWRMRGRILYSTRQRIEAKVKSLLASSADPELLVYYSSLTKRFRRIYLPLLYCVRLLPRVPRKETAEYYLARLFPRTYDRMFWALNPPVT